MSTINHTKQYQLDTALIAGFQKHLPSGTFIVLGQSLTTAQVVSVLQGRADKASAVGAAKAAVHAAVLDAKQEYQSTHDFVQDVRALVLGMYSKSPEVLADFSVQRRKVRKPLTPEQKLIAAAKRNATRQARGIIGKKKRAGIKGSVTGTINVPIDGSGATLSPSPTAPLPATPPAPPGPATTNGSSTPYA